MTASSNSKAGLSVVINNIEFARKALEFHDTIFVCRFSRLMEVLLADEGVLDCYLKGSVNSEGKPSLQLQVTGSLQLRCQRCLEPFAFEVNAAANFILVADEQAIPSEEDESDEMDYLVADMQMSVIDLIEDEILLALPLAPKHAEGQCEASNQSKLDELKKPSPFAQLEKLKR